MKCTDNRLFRKRRNRKRELHIRLIVSVALFVMFVARAVLFMSSRHIVRAFETEKYGSSVYCADLFADNLCVTNEEVKFEEFYRNDEFHGALLFDIDGQEVLYSEHANEQLYPASTTKIMTAYLALKYGKLDDIVTVSANATSVPLDSSRAGLVSGDRLTLEDLLYGLMLPSGNDSAVAIAEHISGSEEKFVELMNDEAKRMGASNTHFVNPHGYQDKEHYTTAYDLYLIFNECIKNETFTKVITAKQWIASITQKNGTWRTTTWTQSNPFVTGSREVPSGVTVIGGKTGTTFDAGACLLLYVKNADDIPYIAIIMGATSRRNLYDNMTSLMRAIPN